MLFTAERYKHVPPDPSLAGESRWNRADIEDEILILFSFVRVGDPPSKRRTALVANLAQAVLMMVLEKAYPVQVEVLSAPIVNGSKDWRMEPLSAVWNCRPTSDPNYLIEIYRTECGNEYARGYRPDEVGNLTKYQKLFEYPIAPANEDHSKEHS